MSHIDQTTGEVTSISGLEGGVSQTLTGTVSGDEILEHGHAFLEIGEDRILDNLGTLGTCLLRLCHKATHTGQLGNLVSTTTGSGVKHHEYRVKALVGLGHLLHEGLLKVGIDVSPGIDNLIVTLGIGNETHGVVSCNLLYLVMATL